MVIQKKNVKKNRKPAKHKNGEVKGTEKALPEEFEEDRDVNIRMKDQPLSQQPDEPEAGKSSK